MLGGVGAGGEKSPASRLSGLSFFSFFIDYIFISFSNSNYKDKKLVINDFI
jgi:hypothetical protein